jgi:hypothetical protein
MEVRVKKVAESCLHLITLVTSYAAQENGGEEFKPKNAKAGKRNYSPATFPRVSLKHVRPLPSNDF